MTMGGKNSSADPTPNNRPPAAIHGRRRPKRVRVRSDSVPTIGSDATSQNRPRKKMNPIVASDRPKWLA